MATLNWKAVKTKKGDRLQIRLLVNHNNTPQYLRMKYYVEDETHFNEDSGIIVHSNEYSQQELLLITKRLSAIKTEAWNIITELDTQGRLQVVSTSFIIKELKKRTGAKSGKKIHSFNSYVELKVNELKIAGRVRTADQYKYGLSVLKKYGQKNLILFHEIDYAFLNKVESRYFAVNRKSKNGLGNAMRGVRAVYNSAIKEGIVSQSLYPFNSYQPPSSKTHKRTLKSENELERLMAYKLEADTNEYIYRNLWIFLFYARGMNMADAGNLKVKDVQGESFSYARNKTGSYITIRITPRMRDVINFFAAGKNSNDYLFPINAHPESKDAERYINDVRNATKQINKYMKRVAGLAGINTPITSYVSRHSFASFARKAGLNLDMIQELLGQESIRSTKVYVESFDEERLNNAAEEVFKKKEQEPNEAIPVTDSEACTNNVKTNEPFDEPFDDDGLIFCG